MALKRNNGPDSDAVGVSGRDDVSGPASEGLSAFDMGLGADGADANGEISGDSLESDFGGMDGVPWTPSSVTYEPEEAAPVRTRPPVPPKLRSPGGAGKRGPRAKVILDSVYDRFPGVFSPPEGAAAPEASMSSFDAPTDANTPLPSIRTGASGKRNANTTNWSIHTIAELVRFRDEINEALPSTELSKLNLEEEVLLQYHVVREMQSDVLGQEDIPPNQKVQVANSVASILKTLADQQESLYTSERFKDIENLLIRSLTSLPEKTASKFLDEYERIVRNKGEK